MNGNAETMTGTVWTAVDGPLGTMLLVGRDGPDGFGLASVSVPGQRGGAEVRDDWRRDDAPFAPAAEQLAAWFAGRRTEFDLPLAPRGTDFQHRVWAALDTVPYGATLTYGGLADRIGAPRAVRAVATAVARNPLLVVRPCHRVVGAPGSAVRYSAGPERKRLLLDLERAG